MGGQGGELFAERLRLEAQAQAAAAGASPSTSLLADVVTTKLAAAWDDVHNSFGPKERASREKLIDARGRRSIGRALSPSLMEIDLFGGKRENNLLLSLIEAEHEVLVTKARWAEHLDIHTFNIDDDGNEEDFVETADDVLHSLPLIQRDPETFRARVNEIFESHDVAFRLTASSRLVPIASQALTEAVLTPTLYLLHDQKKFTGAESAYQKALVEIRAGDAGDAITDAATALQAALTALGCKGGALGQLIASAKNDGLLRGSDTPLTESIVKAVNWVAAQRNDGEAHVPDADYELSDAWMVVHVVGALIIRLADAAGRQN